MQAYPQMMHVYAPFISEQEPLIRVDLVDLNEAWAQFGYHTTEMIVTKPGRHLFPKLVIRITGLRPHQLYSIYLEFVRADRSKYRFDDGNWKELLEEDEAPGSAGKIVQYKEGPTILGSEWMAHDLEFVDFKLTNDADRKEPNMVYLNSHHKYIPYINVDARLPTGQNVCVHRAGLFEAQFIAVTAYQNEWIKKLKVAYNPFAKGARSVHNSKKAQHDAIVVTRRRRAEQELRGPQRGGSTSPSVLDSSMASSMNSSMGSTPAQSPVAPWRFDTSPPWPNVPAPGFYDGWPQDIPPQHCFPMHPAYAHLQPHFFDPSMYQQPVVYDDVQQL